MKENKTEKISIVKGNVLIVGIDIAKDSHEGYYRCPDGTDIKPFSFSNDSEGFEKFWSIIYGAQKMHKLDAIVVGLEPTGIYSIPLVHFLRKKPVRLVQVNPMHSKRMRDISGNSPNKTDKKDPKVIVDVLSLGHYLTIVIPEGSAAELRSLTHARERAVARRTVLLNQIRSLVFFIFPEFCKVMPNFKSKSVNYLLTHHPLPRNIRELGLDSLTRLLWKVSHGKLKPERAVALYESATTSVGVEEGEEAIVMEISHLLSIIEHLNRFIDDVEKKLSYHLKQIPYSHCILSIRGIREITAAGLIGEAGDFRQYRMIAEITKFAGLDLYERSSGRHKGKRRISKRGRPLMRKLLYHAALNMIRKGGLFREQYERYVTRGMIKMKAVVAIARKLLRILFALVRDNVEYEVSDRSERSVVKEAA